MIDLGHTTQFELVPKLRLVDDVRHSYCHVIWNCVHSDFSFAISYRVMSEAIYCCHSNRIGGYPEKGDTVYPPRSTMFMPT